MSDDTLWFDTHSPGMLRVDDDGCVVLSEHDIERIAQAADAQLRMRASAIATIDELRNCLLLAMAHWAKHRRAMMGESETNAWQRCVAAGNASVVGRSE